jgi:hypothetical protein
LAAAINSESKVSDLNGFPEWQQAKPVQPTEDW